MITLSELIKSLISEYIEDLDNLVVDEEDGENTCLIRVKATKTDISRIIGKGGRNVTALRTLINAIASKRKVRVNLHIVN